MPEQPEDLLRCTKCGWTGADDDIEATDRGEGEVILECPGCGIRGELFETIVPMGFRTRAADWPEEENDA